MPVVAYTVGAILPDEATAQEYIAWLEDGHVDHVVRAGAISGMIVRVREPESPIRVEVRYLFANPEVFQAYLDHHAPALRARGLEKFPPSRGVRFERQIGHVV